MFSIRDMHFVALFVVWLAIAPATEAVCKDAPFVAVVELAFDPVKQISPPVSKDEVRAAVTVFKNHSKSLPPADAAVLSGILLRGEVPEGTRLEVARMRDDGGDVLYICEDVNLFLRLGSKRSLNIPVRSRLVRSLTVAEAAQEARDFLKTSASFVPGRLGAVQRLQELESRAAGRK